MFYLGSIVAIYGSAARCSGEVACCASGAEISNDANRPFAERLRWRLGLRSLCTVANAGGSYGRISRQSEKVTLRATGDRAALS
jgi:hypothetical protein